MKESKGGVGETAVSRKQSLDDDAAERAQEAKVHAMLDRCAHELADAMLKARHEQRVEKAFLSNEAWQVIGWHAIYVILRIVSLSPDNFDTKGRVTSERIDRYEEFAAKNVLPMYRRICHMLDDWREKTEANT